MKIHSEATQLLVSLGWPESELVETYHTDSVQHPEHPGLRVGKMPRNPYDEERFVLSFSAVRVHYRKEDEGEISRAVINLGRPNWKAAVLRWFSSAVMRASELRRLREEQVAKERVEHEAKLFAVRQHLTPDLHEYAEVLVSGTTFDDVGTAIDLYVPSQVFIEQRLTYQMPLGQRMCAVAKLRRFMFENGLISSK